MTNLPAPLDPHDLIDQRPLIVRPTRKNPWAKNVVAIVLGDIAGLFLRGVIAIPLFFVFRSDDALPSDLMLLLELFTAFVAGATTGTLVPRFGWIFGLLTQTLEIVLTGIVIGFWAYLVVTDPAVEVSFDPLRAPLMRLMLYAMVTAALGGFVGEKYRESVLTFLASTFGAVAGGIGCAVYALGSIAQLWFLYLGGKAAFEERAIFKAVCYVFVVGPVASYGISLLLFACLLAGGWVFKRIYNWYMPDLDLEPLDW